MVSAGVGFHLRGSCDAIFISVFTCISNKFAITKCTLRCSAHEDFLLRWYLVVLLSMLLFTCEVETWNIQQHKYQERSPPNVHASRRPLQCSLYLQMHPWLHLVVGSWDQKIISAMNPLRTLSWRTPLAEPYRYKFFGTRTDRGGSYSRECDS